MPITQDATYNMTISLRAFSYQLQYAGAFTVRSMDRETQHQEWNTHVREPEELSPSSDSEHRWVPFDEEERSELPATSSRTICAV